MAGKSNGTDVGHLAEWVRAPPPTGPLLQRIGKAIYNPEERSFLGRTPKRWGIVITFYLVFYAVLALMFAICMGGLLLSLKKDGPTYTLDQSLIGTNPGVTARPLPDTGELKIDRSNANSTDVYIDQLNHFFEPYVTDPLYGHAECVPADNFGYPDTPCFFLKLNRIIDWEPHYYDDAASLPEDFPTELVDHIKGLATPAERSRIWAWCWDENSQAELEYPWGRALPTFQTFKAGAKYRNPIVAVRLKQAANSTVIRCRLLAKNIIYNKSLKEPSGYARIIVNVVSGTPSNVESTE
ncbi:sodium/potassium-transporting ATPase subunit beta-1-like [Leguminivora glycinivorella]|uniref:sodium/potassium-transporting ATPase subunit beta-1-like n=1 Tax=Leguminivora glycinivorella TaxID=1035111 RepID=UPI00200F0131|nr:sodium/potassium-transporting ATPase subunit beta-1-like [Leguminivora glycinivorella]